MRRINLKQVADKVCVSVALFRRHHYGQEKSPLLAGFPPPCARGRRLLWLDADIDAWLAAQSTYKPSAAPIPAPAPAPVSAPKRPRGRPRKLAAAPTPTAAGGEGGVE